MKDQKKSGLLENILRKTSYSTGFICAKVFKARESGLFTTAREKSTSLLQNTRKGMLNVNNSFKEGFRSVGDEAEDDKASKPKTKVKTKTSKKPKQPGNRRKIKQFQKESINADFEKEIEAIDREMAEV
jgi:hypothetical protein